jgi:hypothetical protein
VDEGRIELGVFSDTVLIAGAKVEDVLQSSAIMLDFVLQKTLTRSDPSDIARFRRDSRART